MSASFVTVSEAAGRLGVSEQRVRQLIAADVLSAERVGARWLLDRAEVAKHTGARPPGRPLSPRMAWGLLLLLEGAVPGWLSGRDMSRLRRRLRDGLDASEASALCRHRAVVHRQVGHPSAVDRLRLLPGLVLTGVAAGGAIIDAEHFDAYLRPTVLRRVRRELALVAAAPGEEANVVLRVPPSGMWPFTTSKAGPATVAVDLWDAGDVRARREAGVRFDRLVDTWREGVGGDT